MTRERSDCFAALLLLPQSRDEKPNQIFITPEKRERKKTKKKEYKQKEDSGSESSLINSQTVAHLHSGLLVPPVDSFAMDYSLAI